MRGVWVVCLAALTSGCSVALDEGNSIYAAPGKFDFLNCPAIAERSKKAAERETELNGLMQRANQDPIGPVVNALVYTDELNTVRAELLALRKVSDEKRCAPNLAQPAPTPAVAPLH